MAALATQPAAGLEIEPLWVANPDMIMEGAPMVVDLDGDGDTEILTAAYENIIVVDGTGKELWRFDTRGRYSTCPAILERDQQPPLIYAGDNRGMFTCLDGQGNVVWQKDMGNIFCSSSALADLNEDGVVEIIQGDHAGLISALDALTGEARWESQVEGVCSSPAVADLNGDGTLEIVVSTGAGKTFALDASGELIWEFTQGGTAPFWAIASPVLFANSNGQVCVAVASHEGHFYCLDGQGKVLWDRTTRGAVASTISVADFDADGRADLFAVTELGVVYRFDEAGRLLWDIDTQGRSLASGAIIDLNGDGALEYMLCTQRGNLLAFSNAGEVVFNYQFDNRTINVTPAFGDFVRERPGLEFAVTGGESGRIFCFGTSAPVDSLAPWRTYRGDNRLTGSWLGLAGSNTIRMTPENLTWDQIYAGDDITFRVVNPTPGDAALNAKAVCVRPDGSRQVAVGKVVGRQGILRIPVSMTAPGVYRFEWALENEGENPLVNGSRELTLLPWQNDQALASRALLALQKALGQRKVVPTDKGYPAAMYQEYLGIEKEAAALATQQAAAPGSTHAFREQLNARTAALNARAKRAMALAGVSSSILADASDRQLVAFEGTTWENRNVDRQLPSEADMPLHLTRRCITGEHEPVSVKLLNVTLDTILAGARVETGLGGPSVTAHEVKPVPTNQNTTAWDPIVPMSDGRLPIPSLEAREVWLDIDLSGVKAGTHNVNVFFDTGASETKVVLTLEVLPFEMAESGATRLCCWASYNDDAVTDLLAHGNNLFTHGLPSAKVGIGAAPRIEIDFTRLDEFIAPLAGHDVFLLMGGIPALGVPMESDSYVPRLADYLDQLMRHLAARGIDEDRIALYPHDEPGGHGWDTVHHYVAFGRQALKARPGVKLYVNGGGDLAMFQALNEVTSIWCPGFYMLSEDTPEMNFLRESGKTIWSYDCGYSYARPIGANTKTINVVAQYRMAAVFGFHFGATGIGYWCYNSGPSMWDAVEQEYPLVYQNSDDTHTSSRRWEAVREGMEDTRILVALRRKLSDESIGAEVKEKIRHLLEETLSGISRQSLAEVHLGAARYVIDDSNNDGTVERLRSEMLDCVALLTAWPQ
ncbi:MAG: PQQ-binding-like beta-propeller repeat protein [Planctomycetaceae bacterium]